MAKDEVERRVDEVGIVVGEDKPLLLRHSTVSQLETGQELDRRQQEPQYTRGLFRKYLHSIQLPAERA